MKFKKTTLKNGLRIITVPMKESTAVTVLVAVEAGSKYETKDINGLSHFLEHMCFKGTKRRISSNEISRELDSIGAQYNAFTGQELTGYYAKVHPCHFDKALNIIADMYLHPTLPAEEIEKEKGVIVEEINMYEDLPQRHVQEVFSDLMYGDQPAGWSIAGPKEVVKGMTRDHFVNYRDKHYVAKSTMVIVSGKFNEKKAIKDIEKAFAQIQTKSKPKKLAVKEDQNDIRIRLQVKPTDQAHAVIGVRTFGAKDKRAPVLQVLQGVLGAGMSSRLFQKLRDEMGICYYVKTNAEEFTDHGFLSVSTGVDIKRAPQAIEAVCKELSRLKTELVSKEELIKVKDCLVGNMYLSLETSDSLGEFYGIQEILTGKIKTAEEIEKKIRAVTPKQIKDLASQIFVNKNLNLAVVSSISDENIFKKVLSL